MLPCATRPNLRDITTRVPSLLEALFAEARRSEDEADELLVEGGWVEVELPREMIPFPVRPAPSDAGPLTELPLFATNGAASAPPSVTTNGKVVTLEELAQMVRRRRPRPKPVPDGQLALFGT